MLFENTPPPFFSNLFQIQGGGRISAATKLEGKMPKYANLTQKRIIYLLLWKVLNKSLFDNTYYIVITP